MVFRCFSPPVEAIHAQAATKTIAALSPHSGLHAPRIGILTYFPLYAPGSGGTQTVGSPFFGLPYFGEAKKGESPAAATERLRNFAERMLTRSEKKSESGVFGVRAQIPRACGPPLRVLRSEIVI